MSTFFGVVGGGVIENSSGSLKQSFNAETCWRLVGCWSVWESCSRNWYRFSCWQVCASQLLALLWSADDFRKAVGQELCMRTHIHTQSLGLSQTHVQTTSAAVCWVNEQHAECGWPSSAPGKPGPCQRRLPLFVRDPSEITLCMVTKILFSHLLNRGCFVEVAGFMKCYIEKWKVTHSSCYSTSCIFWQTNTNFFFFFTNLWIILNMPKRQDILKLKWDPEKGGNAAGGRFS